MKKYIALAKRHGFDALPRLIFTSAIQNGAFYLLALLEIHQSGFRSWQTFALNYPLAVGFSFLMNRGWVFAGRDRPKTQIWRYVVVYVVVYVFAMGFSDILERMGLPRAWAVLATMAVAAVGLFAALNFWVFPKKKAMPDAQAS